MRGPRMRLLGVMMLAAASAVGGCGKDVEPETPTPEPQETFRIFQFEKFTSAPLVGGGDITLKSLRGNVVLLDLFATWCPSCRRTTPLLVSLYERFHRRDFEIVGLAYEGSGDLVHAGEAVEAFRKEFQIPYRLAIGPAVALEEVQKKSGARGVVPLLLLVDRQGIVRDLFEGLPPGGEAVLADCIERLLAEPVVTLPGIEEVPR